MVSFSNYSYEPSLGTRAAAGKPNVEQADVSGIVKRKLWDIHEDIIYFQSERQNVTVCLLLWFILSPTWIMRTSYLHRAWTSS